MTTRSALLVWISAVWLLGCGPQVDGADGASAERDAAADVGSTCASDVDCSDAVYCNGFEACAPSVTGADDRGCVEGVPPCGTMFCSESLRACTDACVDADGDGSADQACGGSDCDDADGARFPGSPEVCDADDEDCDPTTLGGSDADSDGAIAAACCNGARCGDDCDDTDGAIGPGEPEVCNGRDDDCDASIDEGFECSAAATTPRDCRTPCGSLGTQACTAACVYSACVTADEGPTVPGTCNRCDDDGDGALDDHFACVQGAFLPCTTQCGTSGIGFCDGACAVPAAMPPACVAPTETCNYCDDDGDGSYEDDRGLVEPSAGVWQSPGCSDVVLGTGVECADDAFPAGALYTGPGVQLSDGTVGGRWQAWMRPVGRVGWGRVTVDAAAFAEGAPAVPGAVTDGGWAIVVARGPCGTGPTNDVGVPLDCAGISVEWRFLPGDDQLTVRRLAGDGSGGTVIGTPAAVGAGIEVGSPRTGIRLAVRYDPDLPSTPADEDRVQVDRMPLGAPGAGTMLMYRDAGFGIGTAPDRELRVGGDVRVGVVSATVAGRTTVDWMLSAAYTFATLPSPSITSTSACAP